MPEPIESSKFVSYKARMLREFDSRKKSHSTKLEQRPQIFVKHGLTIDLKRVYISMYMLKKNVYIMYKVKTTKSLKNTRAIRVHEKRKLKNFFDFRFLKNFSSSKP